MTKKHDLITLDDAVILDYQLKNGKPFKLRSHQQEAVDHLLADMEKLRNTPPSFHDETLIDTISPAMIKMLESRTADEAKRLYTREYVGDWLPDTTSFEGKEAVVHAHIQRSPMKSMFSTAIARAMRKSATVSRDLAKSHAIIWDEIQVNDLPFTKKEHSPFVRSVRVWDAYGFKPAIELHKRQPSLLIGADWLRCTTFDLYSMAINASKSFYADYNIAHIMEMFEWVRYLNEVQDFRFGDTTSVAAVYHKYKERGAIREMFRRRSNNNSPVLAFINYKVGAVR